MSAIVKAAAVQISPVLYSRAGTVEKVVMKIRELGKQGVQFATFPETVIPYYPYFAFVQPAFAMAKEHLRLLEQSVTIPSAETRAIGEAAKEANMVVSIGVNERAGDTIYNTQLLFDADGTLIQRRRKIMPTYHERMVWGQGDGSGLEAAETQHGRIGGLICWEHWMPLARQAMHNAGEHIHVAVWPTAHDLHHLASRHYAFEGRCFVLCVGLIMAARDLPRELQRPRGKKNSLLCRGGSAIFAPDGRCLAGPVFDREAILTADLDLAEIDQEKMTLDVSGHYARPDVFEFGIRVKQRTA